MYKAITNNYNIIVRVFHNFIQEQNRIFKLFNNNNCRGQRNGEQRIILQFKSLKTIIIWYSNHVSFVFKSTPIEKNGVIYCT